MKYLRNSLSPLLAMALAFALSGAVSFADDKTAAKTDDPEVAVFDTTEGKMVIQFWTDASPKTIENFKKLAKKGFYDGTCFHRVIKGFMAQGGDPNTKDASKESEWGTGGPGYTIDDEFNNHSHVRGVISMAHTGAPNSGGCQFFICDDGATFLDHQYATFGKVIKGDDVLTKILSTPTHMARGDQPGHPSRPDKVEMIKSIKIVPLSTVK